MRNTTEAPTLTLMEALHEHRQQQTRFFTIAVQAIEALYALRRGDCWCEMAIGNPMVKDHSATCQQIQALLSERKTAA